MLTVLAAGSLVLPLTMNPTSSLPTTNGHLSPLANHVINAEAVVSESESDLSEIADSHNARHVSTPNGALGLAGSDGTNHTETESSNNDDAAGSEDADYDMETPPPLEARDGRDERSLSQESRRPAKRKAGLEDDEHIMNNPELYGLRRSVSRPPLANQSCVDEEIRAELDHRGALCVVNSFEH